MLRKFLLPALAAATLAGCATDYAYRDGEGGDYYYGQPRTEYRYYDPYGGYGSYGYGGGYYYDGFGRLVYGNPYGFYGYPYGGYGGGWYRPRSHRDHDHDGGDNGDDRDGERHDRRPPWRDFDGMAPRRPRMAGQEGEDDARPRRQARPFTVPTPQREQRMIAPMPSMRSGEGGSRIGRATRNPKAAEAAGEE